MNLDFAWENKRRFHTFLAVCPGLRSSCLSEAVVTACFTCCSLHPYFCQICYLRSNKQIWLKIIIFVQNYLCVSLSCIPVLIIILGAHFWPYQWLFLSQFTENYFQGVHGTPLTCSSWSGNDCAYKCDQGSNLGCTLRIVNSRRWRRAPVYQLPSSICHDEITCYSWPSNESLYHILVILQLIFVSKAWFSIQQSQWSISVFFRIRLILYHDKKNDTLYFMSSVIHPLNTFSNDFETPSLNL